jgi:hypothetical protein
VTTGPARLLTTTLDRWRWAPVPRARVAWLRWLLYPFIFVDVFLTTSWVQLHGHVPGALHRPLALGRALDLPAPSRPLVTLLLVALLASAAVAASGRLPRLAGGLVFALYLWWMLVAFSYGKVDHDRFAFLVALAVLPTVGRASRRDHAPDEAAGWAVRCIQLAVVATYLLAVVAKLRFVGLEWVTSSVLLWAIARRGSFLADPLMGMPALLTATQAGIMLLEAASPLLLRPGRAQRVGVAVAAAFHVVTFAAIRIIFLPHVVCLAAFLPLERLGRAGRDPAAAPSRSPSEVAA